MFTVGIDIGSTTCKSVIINDGSIIVGRAIVPFGTGTIGPKRVYQSVLDSCGLSRDDIERTLVTGYGRFTFDDADNQKSEMSCHAKGVNFIIPSARTIIDIGGQDAKALRINPNGMLEDFVMNDKCAAGTGKFLDVMAGILNVKVADLGIISEHSQVEVSISNTCTVFAESEVISKLSMNVAIEDIIAGIHRSVAKKVAALVYRNGIVKDVAMSGGVALNKGVVGAMRKELKTDILVHEDCQLAGALGAALFAWEEAVKANRCSQTQKNNE